MTTCKRCGAAVHRGRCKSMKGSNPMPTTAKPQPPPNPPPVKLNGHLEVAAGLGFRAAIEDGQLRIEQDHRDGDTVYTHELCLAPHEARQLIDFIAEKVGYP